MDIIFENIRCFTRAQRVALKPITLVTGENSSGKSTFLATISAALRPYRLLSAPAFNEPPFHLGNYENIATYKGGKYGRAEFFKVGYKRQRGGDTTEAIGTYVNNRGAPLLKKLLVSGRGLQASIEINESNIEFIIHQVKSDQNPINFTIDIPGGLNNTAGSWLGLAYHVLVGDAGVRRSKSAELTKEIADKMFRLLDQAVNNYSGGIQAIAPLRTKPLRTYDQSKSDYSPDGDHIPYILAKLFDDAKRNKEAQSSIESLVKFGVTAGLFKNIKVKLLGKNVSDPFQVLVTVSGRPANLVDVGYGISQSLHIVIQSLLSNQSEYNLVQQPEVHLHPKAQAAIGSFFCELATKRERKFIIETHSDFIVDRVRQEVAAGGIKPNDVSLLYLSRNGHDTEIHNIEIDKAGNLVNAPKGYREFFMKEELQMLKMGS